MSPKCPESRIRFFKARSARLRKSNVPCHQSLASPRRGQKKDARTAHVNRPAETCPVAECSSAVSRMHAATHLPSIFDDQLEPTEELMRRRISILKICDSRLLGSVPNLNGLVDYVNDLQQLHHGQCQVSIRQPKPLKPCAIFRIVWFQRSSLLFQRIHRHLFCTGGYCW